MNDLDRVIKRVEALENKAIFYSSPGIESEWFRMNWESRSRALEAERIGRVTPEPSMKAGDHIRLDQVIWRVRNGYPTYLACRRPDGSEVCGEVLGVRDDSYGGAWLSFRFGAYLSSNFQTVTFLGAA